ncbi:MAG TPA: TIGR03667 family PPOX class F420-dependent oxidoreductase [Streptosporangiaceae bacterium]|nr:TIGR03667 family PPOX class F420-dependent oxidoreductase [Streptosporangiaceae bacterium]
MILDLSKPAHAEAAERLKTEPCIWLTTVSKTGQPQSSLVWFLWDGAEFLIYGSKTGHKTPNIKGNSRVSLNLDSNGSGGGVITFEGKARIDEAGQPPAQVPDYAAKYQAQVDAFGWTFDQIAGDYPHVIKVSPTRVRAF